MPAAISDIFLFSELISVTISIGSLKRLTVERLGCGMRWWYSWQRSTSWWRHEGGGSSASKTGVSGWRHHYVGPAEARGTGHQLSQLALKLTSKQAVDDEVRCRVDGDDEIADVIKSHVRRTRRFRLVVNDVEQNLQETHGIHWISKPDALLKPVFLGWKRKPGFGFEEIWIGNSCTCTCFTAARYTRHCNWSSLSLRINGHFPRWTWVSRHQNVPFWILLELRMMEVVVTTGAVRRAKLQSNRHRQQTNTPFFSCRVRFLSPNQQCQSNEWRQYNL